MNTRSARGLLFLCICIIVGLMLFFVPTSSVKAELSGCSVTLTAPSPPSVNSGTTSLFSFSVKNTDEGTADLKWVKITRPSDSYTINGYNSSGWTGTFNSNDISFTGGTVTQGNSKVFNVSVVTGSITGEEPWTIEASDNEEGPGSIPCTGSIETSILDGGDVTAPSIDGITISDISDTSVKFTITTDEPTTVAIDYGTTIEYGSTGTSSTSNTSHVITLSGLSANTAYHYTVTAKDAANNPTSTNDTTFTTALTGQTITETIVITNVETTTKYETKYETKTETKTVVKLIEDTIKPTVTLLGDFDHVYSDVPTISGNATDNVGVSAIDYSLDDGKTWIPVDTFVGQFKKYASYSFQPTNLLDGNWQVKVRTKDTSGNIGYSGVVTLIYDRLPPVPGLLHCSFGSIHIEPDIAGTLTFLSGETYMCYVGAVGGPTQMDFMFSHGSSSQSIDTKIPLQYDTALSLWKAEIHPKISGSYRLKIHAIDGAKNQSDKDYGILSVLPRGQIRGTHDFIPNAEITVFEKSPETNEFTIWSGEPYSQENPKKTLEDGSYGFLLPRGIYVVQVDAPSYKRFLSYAIHIQSLTYISPSITLDSRESLQIGPIHIEFPYLSASMKPLSNIVNSVPEVQTNAISTLPMLSFISPDGELVYSSKFRGKPTLLTFVSSWSEQLSDQMVQLELLQKEYPDIAVWVIFIEDSASKIRSIRDTSRYTLPLLSDSDGVAGTELGIIYGPTHIILDRLGTVQHRITGLQQAQELYTLLHEKE
jgi:hypothetical protein